MISIKTRQEIYYEQFDKRMKEIEMLPIPADVPDKHTRLANTYAVKNTERVYQRQFTYYADRKYALELISNGQNIHSLCSLMKMEKDEVMELLQGK